MSEVNLNSIAQDQNQIFIATSQSILKIGGIHPQVTINKLTNETEAFHQLLKCDLGPNKTQILASTDHGIIEIAKDGNNYIDDEGDFPVNSLSTSKFDSNLLYVAGVGQIYFYKFENDWHTITMDLA